MKVSTKLLKMIPKTGAYDSDSVYFFENGNCLDSDGAANNFRNFLIKNRVKHTVFSRLSEMPTNVLIDMVKDTLDGYLVFETTGVTQTFKDLVEIVTKLSHSGYRFKIIECYINTPIFYHIPKEVHDSLEMYTLYSYEEDINTWVLKKLKK